MLISNTNFLQKRLKELGEEISDGEDEDEEDDEDEDEDDDEEEWNHSLPPAENFRFISTT